MRKPYLLSMTAAGQSALNVHGLDTVVIEDMRFTNLIEGGKNVLTRVHLGANEILQMAGRVHGRVAGGRVFILSDRDIRFKALRPTEPEFQLAGDSERVALTCAGLGVRADELELPVPLDRTSYRQAVQLLESRGIIENGRLSQYGAAVEALPVDRAWAELLVHASEELVPYVSIMASIESLHRMTREERDLRGLLVPGSDNLTAYNLFADAYAAHGYKGEVYGLASLSLCGRDRGVGRGARRARQDRRGRRAGHGEHLSQPRARSAGQAADRGRSGRATVRGSARAHHAVRSRHRGAHRERGGGARVEDERVLELRRDRGGAALLRGPHGNSARGDRGHADPVRSDHEVRDARPRPSSCSIRIASARRSCCAARSRTSDSSWAATKSRSSTSRRSSRRTPGKRSRSRSLASRRGIRR